MDARMATNQFNCLIEVLALSQSEQALSNLARRVHGVTMI